MYNAHTFKPIVYDRVEYSVKVKHIIALNLIISKIYNIIFFVNAKKY